MQLLSFYGECKSWMIVPDPILFYKKVGLKNRYQKYLTPDQKLKSKQILNDVDRLTYEETHGTLNFVLGDLLYEKPNKLEFINGRYGKPYLSEKYNSELFFNVSHSKEYFAITLYNKAVGIDIEKIDSARAEILLPSFIFHPEETFFNNLDWEDTLEVWVIKEAILKAAGVGLNVEMSSIKIHEVLTKGNKKEGRCLLYKKTYFFTSWKDLTQQLVIAYAYERD